MHDLELLPLRLGGAWFAVDATRVVEVLGAQSWVALPGASPHVPGVIPWRGRALALVDIGAVAGVAAAIERGERRARVVVASAGGVNFGIPVDGAREVQTLPESALLPLHAARARVALGEVALLDTVMAVIDLDQAVAEALGET